MLTKKKNSSFSSMLAALDALPMGASADTERVPRVRRLREQLQDLRLLPIPTGRWPFQGQMSAALANGIGDDEEVVEEPVPEAQVRAHSRLMARQLLVQCLERRTASAWNATPEHDRNVPRDAANELEQ